MNDLFPQTGFDVRRVLGVLWKWRWAVIGGAVVGLTVGLVDVLQRRPIYKATARVLVERQGPKLLKFVDSDGWVLPPDVPFDTHARLMRTSPVAARVARVAGLVPELAPPGTPGTTDGVPNGIVDELLGGLDTRPSRDELGLVDVTFTSGDPEYAARMANAFAEEYIADRVETSLGLSRSVGEWVDARLADQKKKLAESEAGLQAFREEESFVGPEEEAHQQRLAGLRAELEQTRRDLREAERQRDELVSHRGPEAGRTPGPGGASLDAVSAVAEVAKSGVFQRLAEERGAALTAIAQAETDLGPKHPDMRRLLSKLEAAERGMHEEVDRIARTNRLAIERLQARERSLASSLSKATREAIGAGNRATRYAALQREVELNRQLYETLLRRLKSLGLSADADRSNLRIVERARVPRGPSGGPSLLDVLKATLAGLLLATGVAFLWEYVDSSVKSPEELEGDFGLPLLGVIPGLVTGTEAPGTWLDAPPVVTDAFGAVRTAVVLSAPSSPPQVLLISSPGAGEGKSTVALQLASAMARDGLPTLLVEADLRHPVLHTRMGISPRPGLTELLTSRMPLDAAVRKTALPRLFLVPSGAAAPNPSELLGSERMAELIAEARGSFGRIVIDSAPVFAAAETLALADATTLAAACDGVILVVRARKTSRQAIASARNRLQTVRARILGAVLNDWRRPGPVKGGLYYDGYGYGYGYAPRPVETEEPEPPARREGTNG